MPSGTSRANGPSPRWPARGGRPAGGLNRDAGASGPLASQDQRAAIRRDGPSAPGEEPAGIR